MIRQFLRRTVRCIAQPKGETGGSKLPLLLRADGLGPLRHFVMTPGLTILRLTTQPQPQPQDGAGGAHRRCTATGVSRSESAVAVRSSALVRLPLSSHTSC